MLVAALGDEGPVGAPPGPRSAWTSTTCSPPTSRAHTAARSPRAPATGRACRAPRAPVGVGDCSPPPGGRRSRGRPGTRGCGAVVHAVGEAAGAAGLTAYVEGVVLGSWASPRWTRQERSPAPSRRTPPWSPARRPRGGEGGDPGSCPARRPRTGGDALEHQDPGLAGGPGLNRRRPTVRPRRPGVGRPGPAPRRLRRHPRGRTGLRHPPRLVRLDHEPARVPPPRPRGSCSSARASRSTPVGSR